MENRPLPSLRAVLTQARSLIEDPAHWYPGYARAQETSPPKLLGAGCECMITAPVKVMSSLFGPRYQYDSFSDEFNLHTQVMGSLYRATESENLFLATWNDNHSHAEVLAVFDKAIAACPEDQA